MAVDVTTEEGLQHLLGISTLAGLDITSRQAADKGTSIGYIHGVSASVNEGELTQNLESSTTILAAHRCGSAVQIRFGAAQPPPYVNLYKLRMPVRAARPRPIQCRKCGRLDHVTASCILSQRCNRCGGGHPTPSCEASSPVCSNCRGPHASDNPMCPRWQEERKVAMVIASSQNPVSRRAIRSSLKAGSGGPSYAHVIYTGAPRLPVIQSSISPVPVSHGTSTAASQTTLEELKHSLATALEAISRLLSSSMQHPAQGQQAQSPHDG